MIFPILPSEDGFGLSTVALSPAAPSSLGLLEKDIEHWLAQHPEHLLPGEQVLVIGQSVSGQSMADVLALDALGRLVVIEIKRDWSNRETVGQLLEYAARLHSSSYDELQEIARRYKGDPALDLYKYFQATFSEQAIAREDLGRRQRLLVVAPQADQNLHAIVGWLQSYGVPIQFVPFSVYADSSRTPHLLQIEGARPEPEPVPAVGPGRRVEPAAGEANSTWLGHWIFNTNESYSPGAYEKMFDRHVAAIYGYPNGPQNLEGSRPGDRVLAYVNKQGLRAVGVVVDGAVVSGAGIFLNAQGQQEPGEFHLPVRWEAVVLPSQEISSAQAFQMGYNLPVRSTFARLKQGPKAELLEQELRALAAPAVPSTEALQQEEVEGAASQGRHDD